MTSKNFLGKINSKVGILFTRVLMESGLKARVDRLEEKGMEKECGLGRRVGP